MSVAILRDRSEPEDLLFISLNTPSRVLNATAARG
jgi:hypothetical protein